MTQEADGPADLARRLATDLAAAAGQRDAAYATLYQLGQDQVRLVVIGLDNLCDLAENPRNPHQLTARKLLQTWDQVHGRMAAIRSGIKLPPAGNGPAPPAT